MVQFYNSIPEYLAEWVRHPPFPPPKSPIYFKKNPTIQLIYNPQALSQQVFFTASAPLTGAHINISPKGLPSSTFSIFSPNHAAYIDATGSGSETISHVYENGRVTIMFCSFAKSPRIMRFFCKGSVVEWDDGRFEGLLRKMGKQRIEGARAVILLDVFKVQTSCGFGVPFLTTATHNSEDAEANRDLEPVLLDRDTLGHWSRKKIENNQLLEYQAENNFSSLDGCPGMRAAMRDHGNIVWLTMARARVTRIAAQREALTVGVALGMVFLLISEMLLRGIGVRWFP